MDILNRGKMFTPVVMSISYSLNGFRCIDHVRSRFLILDIDILRFREREKSSPSTLWVVVMIYRGSSVICTTSHISLSKLSQFGSK